MSDETNGSADRVADRVADPRRAAPLAVDSEIEATIFPPEATVGPLTATFLYGLSLPERTVRSTSAVVAGFVNESTTRLLPAAFRTSKSYQLFVQQSIDFLADEVGGVRAKADSAAASQGAEGTSSDAFLARKAVGGMLDFAGIATLHLSPITFLAIFSDLAYGSGTYLKRVGDELKAQGVIDKTSTIDHVSDLIDALQSASSHAADSLDTPPINVQGLLETVRQTRENLQRIDPVRVLPQHEINRLWQEMEQVAARSDATLLDVSTTLTMFTMNRVNLAVRGTLTSATVAGNLFDEHILDHYAQGLAEIREKGLYSTLHEASAPYLDAVWSNFSGRSATLTEEVVTGRLLARLWRRCRIWYRRRRRS